MIQALLMSADKELVRLVKSAAAGLPLKIAIECARTREAVEAFHANPVKLAILDMFLPDTTGIDALKTLKKIDENMAAILISRLRGRSLLERAFRHGAADVIIYPAGREFIRQTFIHRLKILEKDRMVVFRQEE